MSEAPTPLIGDISDRLITAIATGEFLPGSRLPAERELAVLLGVGRTSVRAALVVLHEHGLIETLRGRGGGSFVRTQWTAESQAAVLRTLRARWEEICDRLEAMRRLHGAVARAAAERADESDALRLAALLEAYRSASSGRNRQRADGALHLAIADAAHNDTLKAVLLDLEREISIAAPTHLYGPPGSAPEFEERALAEHAVLVEAIRAGRADEAEAVASEHGRIDLELLQAARRRAERGVPVPA